MEVVFTDDDFAGMKITVALVFLPFIIVLDYDHLLQSRFLLSWISLSPTNPETLRMVERGVN